MAYIICTMILLGTGTATPSAYELEAQGEDAVGPGWVPSQQQFFGIYSACLAFSAFINSLKFAHVGPRLAGWLAARGCHRAPGASAAAP